MQELEFLKKYLQKVRLAVDCAIAFIDGVESGANSIKDIEL